MPEFNLNNYENVKLRKKRFYEDYPEGRITVEQISGGNDVLEYAEFKAYVYLNADEQARGLPRSTGHALELRDKELSTSVNGKKYESVNYTSWTENAEESAVGRALDNAGYASDPSKQEMLKVRRHAEILNRAAQNSNEGQDGETEAKRYQIKRLYAIANELGTGKDTREVVTSLCVKAGFGSLNSMSTEQVKALADKVESLKTK